MISGKKPTGTELCAISQGGIGERGVGIPREDNRRKACIRGNMRNPLCWCYRKKRQRTSSRVIPICQMPLGNLSLNFQVTSKA